MYTCSGMFTNLPIVLVVLLQVTFGVVVFFWSGVHQGECSPNSLKWITLQNGSLVMKIVLLKLCRIPRYLEDCRHQPHRTHYLVGPISLSLANDTFMKRLTNVLNKLINWDWKVHIVPPTLIWLNLNIISCGASPCVSSIPLHSSAINP